MMKNWKNPWLICGCALLAGCASFPVNSRDIVLNPPASGRPKPSLTYTLRRAEGTCNPFGSVGGLDYRMRFGIAEQRCSEAFESSGLFSSVECTTAYQGDVHFDFFLDYSGGNAWIAVPSICTLTILPCFFNEKIQLTADRFVDGDYVEQKKYDRKVRKLWWAPAFPLQLIGCSMQRCERKMFRQLCYEALVDWQNKGETP